MGKQNPYQIGDKPRFNGRPNSNHRDKPFRKNYSTDEYSRSKSRKPFGDKNKPIRKQYGSRDNDRSDRGGRGRGGFGGRGGRGGFSGRDDRDSRGGRGDRGGRGGRGGFGGRSFGDRQDRGGRGGRGGFGGRGGRGGFSGDRNDRGDRGGRGGRGGFGGRGNSGDCQDRGGRGGRGGFGGRGGRGGRGGFGGRDNRDNRENRVNNRDNNQNRENRNNKQQREQRPKFQNKRSQNNNKKQNQGVKRENNFTKRQQTKQKVEKVAPPTVQGVATQIPKQKRIKHNRIIIRNLVFDVNEIHLRKLLSPFGEILDIHIPKNPDNKGSRGFAFVEFGHRNHALKAIKQLNGTKFKGRPIVLDESVSKQRYLGSKVNEQQKQKQLTQEKKQSANKVKLQQSKIQKIQEQDNDQDSDKLVSNDQQQEQNNQDNEDQQEQVKPKKQYTGKRDKTEAQIVEDISSQIFIRNLPINVTQQQLHQFFRRYGQLKFAKVVINKQTGMSKGSAFLKYTDPIKAKQLIEYSRNYEMNLLGKNPNFKINPAINLQLQGTILKVFPVQSRVGIDGKIKQRDQWDKKRQQAKKDDKKKKPIKKVKNLEKLIQYDPNDKRNLKLALLGINQVTQDMRQKDQQRFRNHQKQKLQKLKNPNNSVSDKRIVLKFLNKQITQQQIKTLCQQYLSQTQHKPNDLTYCKLMLESLQSKKSAGFAFIQFKTHQISVGFLQWISQQPTKLMKQPFVCEFAIQDSRKMMKLQNRNQKPNDQQKRIQKSKSNNKQNKNKNKK